MVVSSARPPFNVFSASSLISAAPAPLVSSGAFAGRMDGKPSCGHMNCIQDRYYAAKRKEAKRQSRRNPIEIKSPRQTAALVTRSRRDRLRAVFLFVPPRWSPPWMRCGSHPQFQSAFSTSCPSASVAKTCNRRGKACPELSTLSQKSVLQHRC
jgi:hypothetical protein